MVKKTEFVTGRRRMSDGGKAGSTSGRISQDVGKMAGLGCLGVRLTKTGLSGVRDSERLTELSTFKTWSGDVTPLVNLLRGGVGTGLDS